MSATINSNVFPKDSIGNLAFVAYIQNKNGEILCLTTTQRTINYKNHQAQNALKFNNVLNSLATSKNGVMDLEIININNTLISFFNATIEILLHNPEGVDNFSMIFSGFITSKNIKNIETCTISMVPLTTKLNYNIGEFFSEFCRAELGDSRCRIALSPYTENAKVESVINNRVFKIEQSNRGADFFSNGIIKFLDGKNKGAECRIMHQDHETIYLLNIPNFEIKNNDNLLLTTGCDKSFKTCRDKFKNIINFRGEPFINGNILREITKPVETNNSSDQKGGK